MQQLQQRLAELSTAGTTASVAGAQYEAVRGIVWTPSLRRMYTLLDRYRSRIHSFTCHSSTPSRQTILWSIFLLSMLSERVSARRLLSSDS